MSVIVAFLFAISLWYLSSNHKVTFVKLKATDLKLLPNRGWHRLTPAGGTFVSATGGTFQSDTPGTFVSACAFLILVDSDWSLPLKEVDSGLTLLLV